MLFKFREDIDDEAAKDAFRELARLLVDLEVLPIYTGVGTPESNVVAGIGSLYTDTAGGAGTTLYVKESGTGDTGWVAK